MATVPVYDLPTQQLNAGGMTPAQAPEFQNYTGKQIEAVGKTASSIGETMYKIGVEIQNKYDDAKTKELFNSASSEIDQIRAEYLTQPAAKAVDSYAAYQQKINDVLREHGERAENPVQRGMFQTSSSTIAKSAETAMLSHRLQQLNVYRDSETKSQIDTLRKQAVLYAGTNSPDEQKYMAAYFSTGMQLMDDMGAGDEARKQFKTEMEDKLVNAAVTYKLSMKDYSGAKSYLDNAIEEGAVSAEEIPKLRDMVDRGGIAQKSLDVFNEYSGMGVQAALKDISARSKLNPKNPKYLDASVFDAVHQRLEGRRSDETNARNESGQYAYTEATKLLFNNRGAQPPYTVNDLPIGLQRTLVATGHWDNVVSFGNNYSTITDPSSYNEAMTMTNQQYQAMTYAEFFNKFRPKLSNTAWNEAEARFNAANNKATAEGTHIITNADLVKNSAVKMGIISGTTTLSDKEQKALFDFQSTVDLNIKAWENSHGGKPATQDDVIKILDQLNLDTVSKGGWWNTNAKIAGSAADISTAFYTIQPTPENQLKKPITVRFNDIPADTMQKIKAALISRGKLVTMQNIALTYAQSLSAK